MARVLLIDDDELVRSMLDRHLARSGHEVVLAENGRIGLDAFRNGSFDIVVTDIIMPDTEGIETIISLRQMSPTIPIVAISGGGRQSPIGFLAPAKQLGASAVLQKPFTPRQLSALIDDLLDGGLVP